ncbi:MAG: site-specific DNA-methyltransferase [Candidatus Zixiibacteriota bacterium]
MAKMKAASIDLIVTSPPYNLGINYNSYNDNIPRFEYLEWITEWGEEASRILKEDGSLFLNIGAKPLDPTIPFQVLDCLQEELTLQNIIHWIKSIYVKDDSYGETLEANVGHYKPINSPRFINDAHEYIFHLTKTGNVTLDRLAIGVPYKDKSNIKRWKNGEKELRCRGNCWYIPYKTIQSRDKDRPHPATFPPELAENCIKLHGIKPGMKVLDPFMGLGNTGLACKKLNVDFIGFEIDPYYFKMARTLISGKKETAVK